MADERLPGWVRPSNWYLAGFLVPRGAPAEQRGDADVDDEPEVAENAGLGDDSAEDRRAAKKGFFPSSMGLSFLVGTDVDSLEVVVRWGDYRRIEAAGDGSDEDRREEAHGTVRPKVYYDPRSVEPGGPAGVLHAKAVVADEESVFITSANLTDAAQDRNIELGLLMRDRALAETTVLHFRTLIEKDLLARLPDA